jgi:hypothetical protein
MERSKKDFPREMLVFSEVLQGIQLKIEKWEHNNQFPIVCLNSSQLTFVVGKFLSIYIH